MSQTQRRPEKKQKPQSPEKFRSMAAAMQRQIDAKLDPAVAHQRMTRRRAMMASNANAEGRRLLEVQQRLLAMASAIESGILPEILKGITSRAQVEYLTRYERFPSVLLREMARKDIITATSGVPGAEELKAKIPEETSGYGEYLSHDQIEVIEQLVRIARDRGADRWCGGLADSVKEYRRMYDAGITNEEDYTEARGFLLGLECGSQKEAAKIDRELEARNLERSLVGINIPGYFPTPKDLADQLVNQAEIGEGMRILEPSAGKGDLLEAIARECNERGLEGVEVDAIEINSRLCDVLENKGHGIIRGDFLEHSHPEGYDRVIMNPPFEKGQDIEHVRRAYELLKPGGRVAAIMSEGPFFRNDRKAVEFREWLEGNGGRTEKNTQGAFYDGDRPTGVTTRIVIITKPACCSLDEERGAACNEPEGRYSQAM